MRAFQHMISACEGTLSPEGYAALYGWRPGKPNVGRIITDFSDHPRKKFWLDGRPVPPSVKPKPYSFTTAAGRYQATATTWDRFTNDVGPRDFTPPNQDLFCTWCIAQARALSDVLAFTDATLVSAITKCSPTWASLPYNKANQPHRTLKFCVDMYHSALQDLLRAEKATETQANG